MIEYRSLAIHAVALDVVLVELPPEARAAGQMRCSRRSTSGRLVTRFHQIGSRSGWKTSRYVPCGWLARRWAAIWGSSWCASSHAVERERRGHATPVRVATGPRRIEVADVDRALLHQVAAAVSASTRSARRRPGCRRVPEPRACRAGRSTRCTVPRTTGCSSSATRDAQVECLRQGVALIRVDRDDEVRHRPLLVRSVRVRRPPRRAPADLELAAPEAHL